MYFYMLISLSIFSGKRVVYTKWAALSPSANTNICIAMNSVTGEWQDVSCTARNKYICELGIALLYYDNYVVFYYIAVFI